MTFKELLTLVSSKNPPQVCINSRLVKPGDIFIALPGTNFDGYDFLDQAVAAGAEYVVSKRPYCNEDTNIIIVEDSAQAAAMLVQASRGEPASKLTNLAVTGTNGKTTVAFLVRSIIRSAGQKCGLIGTIYYDTGEKTYEASLTTPDCLDVAEIQYQMVQAGAKYMVIEASSHALAQNRLAAINFKAAAFTNLAGDHLDYHKTKTDYLAAKAKLFQDLPSGSVAVLNKQSAESHKIAEQTKADILWYAVEKEADITGQIKAMDAEGTAFLLEYAGQSRTVKISLPGRYNVANCLAAAGLTIAIGFDLKTVADGLSALKTIPGRLEKLPSPGFSVFIDYAHTDDALKNTLATLKTVCKGNLIVVFGCGGDRDKTKRPRMAKVAEQLADFVIVTSDNPRTEDPLGIINDITTGFSNPDSQKIIVEADRRKAIKLAIERAAKNDFVLIAGKGHETYQIIGKQKFDFSDKKIAQDFIKRIK